MRHRWIIARFIIARTLMAIFSNLVPIRRHSFSQPIVCSTMLRRLWACLSKTDRPSCLSFLFSLSRDQRLDPVLPKPVSHAIVAGAFVARQSLWPLAWPSQRLRDSNLIHHRLDARRVVRLSSSHFDRQRQAPTVSNQVELAAESTSRAAQSVVFRLFRGMRWQPGQSGRFSIRRGDVPWGNVAAILAVGQPPSLRSRPVERFERGPSPKPYPPSTSSRIVPRVLTLHEHRVCHSPRRRAPSPRPLHQSRLARAASSLLSRLRSRCLVPRACRPA